MKRDYVYLHPAQNGWELYRGLADFFDFYCNKNRKTRKQISTVGSFWKLSDGAGGYEPGQLTVNKQNTIDKETWEEFQKILNQIDFWNMKTNETELLGTDGSQWILEGKTVNKYHVVDRWTPSEKSKFYQCCDYLIGLTDLKIRGDDKY